MASITESGRIIDVSTDPSSDVFVRELVDGRFVRPSRPVSMDEIFNARVLSDAELSAYMEKSGRPN